MIDILLYIFDEKLADDAMLVSNRVGLQQQLVAQGFSPHAIHQALIWLKELQEWFKNDKTKSAPHASSIRIWSSFELKKFSRQALEMITHLEQQEVIDQWQREVIIDRAMAIEMLNIDVEQIKWITLIVLYYARTESKPISWIEHVLLQEPSCQH